MAFALCRSNSSTTDSFFPFNAMDRGVCPEYRKELAPIRLFTLAPYARRSFTMGRLPALLAQWRAVLFVSESA